MPGAYHRIRFARAGRRRRRDRDDAPRADPGVRRAGRAPGRRAVPAAVRPGGDDAALRRARAGARAPAGRPREGQRHRDDLHLRRHHRRHLVARAVPAGARGHSGRRHAAAGDVGRAGLGVGRRGARAAALRRARAACRPRRRARRSSSSCGRRGDLVGEPRPITHAVKFFEKGDRPLEIVTSRQWFIKTIEFREALLARGRELQWHPPYMRGAVRELGQRPERRLVHQPPALLRRAVSRLVPARRERRGRTTTRPIAAREDQLPDRSVHRRAGRLPAPTSAACPAGSPAIRTSWTRGPPRR